MHFYLPRRHRRSLLFPPGLLALAGLLWLGCVALGPWQDRLKLRSVLQVTMPTFPQPTRTSTISVRYDLPSLAQVNVMGPWRETYITGKSKNQVQERSYITAAVRTMMTNYGHNSQIRIHLAPTAHYKDLVFLLDLMNRENVRKYWFDITHEPTVFYAIADLRPRVRQADSKFSCFLCNDVIPYIPPPPSPVSFWVYFNNSLTNFYHFAWLSPLLKPEWRVSAWFLAAIFLLGGWRVIGPRRATKTA